MGDISKHPVCGDCSDVHFDQVSSIRVRSRSADVLNVAVFTGLVWSVAATPSTRCMGRQAHLDKYSPALTQPKLSVSTAILIC